MMGKINTFGATEITRRRQGYFKQVRDTVGTKRKH